MGVKNFWNIFGTIIAYIIATVLPCISSGEAFPMRTRTQLHMGTYFSISLQQQDSKHFEKAFLKGAKIDQLLSTYKKDSEISQLNRFGTGKLSLLTLEAIRQSTELAKNTSGAFNITLGSLTKDTYGFRRNKKNLPSQKQIDKSRTFVGLKNLTILGSHATLKPGTQLDFGGIGKGFAVDQMIQFLNKNKVTKAVVSASGDIGCIGSCLLAIRNPFSSSANDVLIGFQLRSKFPSISTSGTYENRLKNGVHHLLNPKTGRPSQTFQSVTLIGNKNNSELDGLATAIGASSLKDTKRILKRYPNIGAFLIINKKTIISNDQFLKMAKNLRWPHGAVEIKMINKLENKKP